MHAARVDHAGSFARTEIIRAHVLALGKLARPHPRGWPCSSSRSGMMLSHLYLRRARRSRRFIREIRYRVEVN